MASPPKPWERNRAAAPVTAPAPVMTSPFPAATTLPSTSASTTTAASSTASASSSTTPAIPPIPASLAASVNQNAAAYSRLGTGAPAMTSSYGGYGAGYTPYRYGGYGGLGGGMGAGLGGGLYGGGYGGYGGGYGSMYSTGGIYGGGAYGGGQRDPNDPNSLTNRFNTGTQATFQMLEGIVGAFGGFAQMLESTYMATHSSFFAMVSVAEQFGNLRDALGSVLGIFTLMRWIRTMIAKLTGRPLPVDATALTPAAFARFEGRAVGASVGAEGSAPKPSRKPLLFFVLAAFGLPYLMSKAIKSLAASQEEEERRKMALLQQQQQRNGMVISGGQLQPAKLEFCRVLYDYTPDKMLAQQQAGVSQQSSSVPGLDLAVKHDELVVVLSKADPMGNPSDWWQCRTRDGRVGYLPSTFLRAILPPSQAKALQQQKQLQQQQPKQIMPGTASTAPSSITGSVSDISSPTITTTTTNALLDPVMVEKAAAQKQQQQHEELADRFMKSAFYQ